VEGPAHCGWYHPWLVDKPGSSILHSLCISSCLQVPALTSLSDGLWPGSVSWNKPFPPQGWGFITAIVTLTGTTVNKEKGRSSVQPPKRETKWENAYTSMVDGQKCELSSLSGKQNNSDSDNVRARLLLDTWYRNTLRSDKHISYGFNGERTTMNLSGFDCHSSRSSSSWVIPETTRHPKWSPTLTFIELFESITIKMKKKKEEKKWPIIQKRKIINSGWKGKRKASREFILATNTKNSWGGGGDGSRKDVKRVILTLERVQRNLEFEDRVQFKNTDLDRLPTEIAEAGVVSKPPQAMLPNYWEWGHYQRTADGQTCPGLKHSDYDELPTGAQQRSPSNPPFLLEGPARFLGPPGKCNAYKDHFRKIFDKLSVVSLAKNETRGGAR